MENMKNMANMDHQGMGQHGKMGKGAYAMFALELAIDFVLMFFVMYTMINSVDELYLNLNNLYMTLMMVAAMAVVMLITMRSMFPNPMLNRVLLLGSVVVFAASYAGMRTQAGVGDAQFLRSMIPHHSGAILMCEQASLSDPKVIALCAQIIPAQRAEIAEMKAILDGYSAP